MNKQLVQIRQRKRVLQLTWIMNNICNNKCAYCPPELNSGTNHHYEWDKARSFIQRLFDTYPDIHCSISGGEPTLSPFFEELVDIFHNSRNTVGITTNGVRTLRFWNEIAPKLNYICFSYHPSQEVPEFLEKVIACSTKTAVTVRVMMDSRYWDKSLEMYNKCFAINNIIVEAVRILPGMAKTTNIGEKYTPEQEEILVSLPRKSQFLKITENPKYKTADIGSSFYYEDGSYDENGEPNTIVTLGKNNFKGWACTAGIESIFIHFRGIVRRANCLEGGTLFHIDDHEKHELPKTGIICGVTECMCGTDVLLSKVRL